MAANNMQEAGLILTAQGADEFKSAMKGISAATKEAYSELKLAQSQYDKNTSSVDKLADRQKYLQKMTEEYTKKEQILQAQLEQMENAEERDEAAIAKKKAEINNCKASLNKYEDALKDVTKQIEGHSAQLKEWGEKLKDVGGKMKDVGKTLTTHVTAPIVGVGGAALAAFNEVDKGYDTVIKKTGAAGDAAQEMYDIVDKLATSIPTDFETAGSAVGEVNTRFGLTGHALERLSGEFIKFAKLNGTDVSSSIDEVQKALSAFGLGAGSAEALLNQLNATGQATGVSVDTLTAGLIQNGTAFQELGLDINQSVAMMGELEKSGANGETVMQGLRKALKSAAKDGKPLNEALAELQDKIENGSEGMDGLTAAYEVFGKSGDQIYSAIKNGSLDFRNLGDSAGNAAGSINSTFEETLSPMDEWAMTLNELKLSGAALGSTLGEMLVPAIQKAAEIASSLREKWEELSPQQQQAIVTIAAIVAALGPVLSVVGSVITTIGSLVTIMGAASAGGGVMAVVIAALTGPIGIAIAAIAAMIAIGTALYLNWDKVCQWAATMKENVTTAWNTLKSNVSSAVEGIKSNAIQKFEDIKSKIQEKIESARDKVHDAIEKIKGFFDFEWSLPHIKLPHFSVSGEFSLNPPSIPHFDVDWYKTGGVFDAPSVIGVGEAGPEAVLPLETLWKKLDEIADRIIQSGDRHAAEMYRSLIAALAEMSFVISDREFARLLRKHGAIK